MPDRIEREVTVPAPIERTWRLVTDPRHIGRWFSGAVMEPRVGAEATFDCGAEELFRGVVERVDPPRAFAFRWCLAPGCPVDRCPSTLVEICLAADGEQTRVRLSESGFAALDPAVRTLHQPGNAAGWGHLLEQLRGYASTQLV